LLDKGEKFFMTRAIRVLVSIAVLALFFGSAAALATEDPGVPVLNYHRFGPTVADGRVPLVLHLLAPNQRPVQVTQDLAGFWRTGWAEVRKELRGRYPKHDWPEDPAEAVARRGTGRK